MMLDPIQHMPDGAKPVIDAGAFLAFVAHLVGVSDGADWRLG